MFSKLERVQNVSSVTFWDQLSFVIVCKIVYSSNWTQWERWISSVKLLWNSIRRSNFFFLQIEKKEPCKRLLLFRHKSDVSQWPTLLNRDVVQVYIAGRRARVEWKFTCLIIWLTAAADPMIINSHFDDRSVRNQIPGRNKKVFSSCHILETKPRTRSNHKNK